MKWSYVLGRWIPKIIINKKMKTVPKCKRLSIEKTNIRNWNRLQCVEALNGGIAVPRHGTRNNFRVKALQQQRAVHWLLLSKTKLDHLSCMSQLAEHKIQLFIIVFAIIITSQAIFHSANTARHSTHALGHKSVGWQAVRQRIFSAAAADQKVAVTDQFAKLIWSDLWLLPYKTAVYNLYI